MALSFGAISTFSFPSFTFESNSEISTNDESNDESKESKETTKIYNDNKKNEHLEGFHNIENNNKSCCYWFSCCYCCHLFENIINRC